MISILCCCLLKFLVSILLLLNGLDVQGLSTAGSSGRLRQHSSAGRCWKHSDISLSSVKEKWQSRGSASCSDAVVGSPVARQAGSCLWKVSSFPTMAKVMGTCIDYLHGLCPHKHWLLWACCRHVIVVDHINASLSCCRLVGTSILRIASTFFLQGSRPVVVNQ